MRFDEIGLFLVFDHVWSVTVPKHQKVLNLVVFVQFNNK